MPTQLVHPISKAWYDDIWMPIQSPLGNSPITDPNPVKHPPVTTRKGRVVYDRKTHFFTDRDVVRISSQYFNITYEKNTTYFWMELLEKLTIWMLDKVLGLLLNDTYSEEISERLYYLARDFLAKIIDRILPEYQDKLKSEVSGGAH